MQLRSTAFKKWMAFAPVFIGGAVLVVSLMATPPSANSAASSQGLRFIGLKHPSPGQIKALMPEVGQKPTVLEFSSRFCHDCRVLKPVLTQVMAKQPGIHFKPVDIIDDQNRDPALIRAFRPVTVPVLIFINKQGEIRAILYNAQPASTITAALATISPNTAAVKK